MQTAASCGASAARPPRTTDEVSNVPEEVSAQQHEAYQRIHASEQFGLLRGRFRTFAFSWTVAFMLWYLLYVFMSSFAEDFMSIEIVGNINVALVFGLLQFASTFLIAALYSWYANNRLDPIGAELLAEYDLEEGR